MENKKNIQQHTPTNPTLPQPKDNCEVISLYSKTLILFCHILLSWVMSSINPKTFNSCQITSFKLFFGGPLPLLPSGDVNPLADLHSGIHVASLHMIKPSESTLSHLMLDGSHFNCASNYFIPNSIRPRLATHSSSHSHRYYHQPLNLCLFNWPTVWVIQHNRSNYGMINFAL